MSVYMFRIRSRGPTPRLIARELNRLKKIAWATLGRYWHIAMRPKHFTRAGAREYGYMPRVGEPGRPGKRGFHQSYTGRKLKQFGHTDPMVFTGESRSRCRMANITATSKGVRITMSAPKLERITRPGWDGKRINLYDEMTRISIAEKNTLERFMRRKLDSLIRGITATESK